jgi:hypothetical protein
MECRQYTLPQLKIQFGKKTLLFRELETSVRFAQDLPTDGGDLPTSGCIPTEYCVYALS